MANQTVANLGTALSLLKKIDKTNPEIAQAIEILAKQFQALYLQVNPPVTPVSSSAAAAAVIGDVTNFQAVSSPTNLRFTWTRVSNAFQYEIRQGAVWATASPILGSSTNSANFDPRVLNLTVGSHTFLIKALDSDSNYSVNAASVVVTVDNIGIATLTGQAIQNTALLDWETPSSTWLIAYYNVYKDAVLVGRVTGTFSTISVVIGGTYSFTITSVDIVGNESSASPSVSLRLLDPENYILLDDPDATYGGTYTNSEFTNYIGSDGIVGPVPIETWAQHYVNNAWATPQAQITAGYPKYLQPAEATGQYEEQFDLGSILDNFTVAGQWTQITLSGTVTITIQLSSSTDGVSWSAWEAGPTIYYASARYVKCRWIFTPLDDTSIAFIYNLYIDVTVQFTVDSGEATCLLTDVSGTEIFYNKTFNMVASVVGTAVTNSDAIVVVDSITGASFLALVFDANGNRITELVSWQARGTV